jgi:nucleotide-binding universal stress UspA family protein
VTIRGGCATLDVWLSMRASPGARTVEEAVMPTDETATGPVEQPSEPGVVVAYDGSAQAAAALRWGAHEAAAEKVPLDIVVAWQPATLALGSSSGEAEAAHAEQLAQRAAATAETVGGRRLVVREHVERGAPRSVILRRGKAAHVVIMGTSGHVGRLGALLGSTSRYVVERVDTPVVLIGPHAAGYVESRIVVISRYGVADGRAVSWAVDRARTRPRCTLHLLDTWSPPGLGIGLVVETARSLARRQAVLAHEQAMEELRAAAGEVPVSGALYEGRPADIEYAHGLPGDLLVVGAADVDQRPSLTNVRCPVAIIPPLPASASATSETTSEGAERLVDAGGTSPG